MKPVRQNRLFVAKVRFIHRVIHNRAGFVNGWDRQKLVKIVLVTETFPPEINGVAMTLHRVVEGLATRGHTLEVVCPKRNDRKSENSDRYSLFMLPGLPIPRYQDLRFGLPAARRLQRRWSKFKPDLIHIATEGPLGWSAVRAARALNIPFITTFHTNFHSYGAHYGYGFLNKTVLWWLRSIRKHALGTFVPSEVLRDELAQQGFRNLQILSRGVDTELYGPSKRDPELRASWGANEDTPIAIYVGRVAGEKNIPLTVQAYRRMQQTLPTMKLVIVGDGPERPKLEKQNPDIIFAGMRRGEDLARHYASGDVFIFASITETFGNVITEAMASRLLVISYDYAAAHKFIRNGENGATALFNNPSAFLECADACARRHAEWPGLRDKARETALDISWNRVLDGFETKLLSYLPRPATATA